MLKRVLLGAIERLQACCDHTGVHCHDVGPSQAQRADILLREPACVLRGIVEPIEPVSCNCVVVPDDTLDKDILTSKLECIPKPRLTFLTPATSGSEQHVLRVKRRRRASVVTEFLEFFRHVGDKRLGAGDITVLESPECQRIECPEPVDDRDTGCAERIDDEMFQLCREAKLVKELGRDRVE